MITRIHSVASAAVWLVAAASFVVPPALARPKKCLDEISSVDELLEHVLEADVFVKVDRRHASKDDTEAFDELCRMYEDAPEERKSAVTIGRVHGDEEAELAEDLGASDEGSWPTYVVVPRGTTSESDLPGAIKKYDGPPAKTTQDLVEYLRSETGATIGSYVYSLPILDVFASKFHSVRDDDRFGWWKKRLMLHAFNIFAFLIELKSEPEVRAVVKMYVRTFSKSLDDAGYASKQTARIEGMLEKDSHRMSTAKREELSQRLHVLSKFAEPRALTSQEETRFLVSMRVNAFLLVAFVVIVIQWIVGSCCRRGRNEDEPHRKED